MRNNIHVTDSYTIFLGRAAVQQYNMIVVRVQQEIDCSSFSERKIAATVTRLLAFSWEKNGAESWRRVPLVVSSTTLS